MTIYVRLNPLDSSFNSFVSLDAEQYDQMVINGKALYLRLYIDDPMPTPSPTQVVIPGALVIGEFEAHQTYVLRDKTAAELDIDSERTERAVVRSYVQDLRNGAGTNAERLIRVERGLAWILKRFAS